MLGAFFFALKFGCYIILCTFAYMERRSGNTTRLVDQYVQTLFTEGRVHLIDHYDGEIAHRMLVRQFKNRMKNEHPYTKVDYQDGKFGTAVATLKRK